MSAHHLLLIAGQAVSEQQEHLVLKRLDQFDAACSLERGGPQAICGRGCDRRRRETDPSERERCHAVLSRSVGGDLTRRGAPHQRHVPGGIPEPQRQLGGVEP